MPSTEWPIGKDCFLYYGAIADYDSPSPTLIEEAVDVSQPGITKNMVDLPSRGTGGWNPKGAGLKGMDVSFGYLYQAGADAVRDALRSSFLNDDVLDIFVLDGPIAGLADRAVQGFRMPGIVSEFPISQELEDGERIEIKVDLARYKDSAVNSGALVIPTWHSIAATG